MADQQVTTETLQELEKIIDAGNVDHLEAFLQLLPPGETAYAIARLPDDKQTQMLSLIRPEFAADLMEYLSDEHAADLIEELPPQTAAAIVDEMPSDDQADILIELPEAEQQAIIEQMSPEEAADARRLVAYEHDTAGGIMITEFLAYDQGTLIDDVIADLHRNAEKYAEYDVQYVYVTDDHGKLLGVVTVRSLLLSPGDRPLTEIMIQQAVNAAADATLDELEDLFDRYDFNGVPVLGPQGRIIGVVTRADTEEALGERAEGDLLRFGGIIGGEELRSMPLRSRTLRRLAFLVPNILLSMISISIIAFFEPTIKKFTVLAVFLPLVANLSGASGNQAVAVSLRELTLGLLKPRDVWLVFRNELGVGALNGLAIGLILALIALAAKGDMPALAVVIGVAYAINSVIAVVVGGSIPLMLVALRMDPAMASSPLLTTVTDMGSFFIVLSIAAAVLPMFAG